MTEDELIRWAETLGYSPDWRELGIATAALVEEQAVRWMEPDSDRNPEHYRYGAWKRFLSAQDELPPELVKALLALDLREAGLAGSAVSSFGHAIAYDLVGHPALTLEGLELLRRHPVDASSFARALARAHVRLTGGK